MDWSQIVVKVRLVKEYFDRSYKCLNTDRPTKTETIEKHIRTLFTTLEDIRVILNVHYSRLNTSHKAAADNFFLDVCQKLVNVLSRKKLDVTLPSTLHERVEYSDELRNLLLEVDSQASADEPQKSSTISDKVGDMPQTVTEFLGLAAKLVPEFDGKPENLQAFIDALNLLETIKETHEAVAVNVIKTKLKGTARNLITSESSIGEISQKLRVSVKGESTEVLSAKIMNVRQNNKSANVFVNELEELTKALSNAYIADGLPNALAEKYSTQTAVKAMTKNASNDRVRLIMASGNFGTMNEAVSKFVNSSTEIASSTSGVMYYNSGWKRSGNGRGRGRGYNNSRGHGRGNHRGRGYHNRNNFTPRGGNYNGNSRGNRDRNVRVASRNADDSENANLPLGQQ